MKKRGRERKKERNKERPKVRQKEKKREGERERLCNVPEARPCSVTPPTRAHAFEGEPKWHGINPTHLARVQGTHCASWMLIEVLTPGELGSIGPYCLVVGALERERCSAVI